MVLEARIREFMQDVEQLDAQETWLVLMWLRQLAASTTRRVWVTEPRRAGTGPLVLVGDPQSASA